MLPAGMAFSFVYRSVIKMTYGLLVVVQGSIPSMSTATNAKGPLAKKESQFLFQPLLAEVVRTRGAVADCIIHDTRHVQTVEISDYRIIHWSLADMA